LQPTALVLDDRIRVFAGARDEQGVARVIFVDLDRDDPGRVLRVSERPVLDIGNAGCFDDNGVVPCAAVRRDDGRLFLYYGGYQLATKVKFLAFGGLAISSDDGESFERYSEVPVMERAPGEAFFKAAHCVLFEEGVWKMWYGTGTEFVKNDRGDSLPKYCTRYVESADGIYPDGPGEDCFAPGGVEYKLGRASVIRTGDLYRMFFAWATMTSGLQLGYAESTDGRTWCRNDAALNLAHSENEFDSRHMSSPNVVRAGDKFYLFYNGNDYGRQGFGFAELLSW
jgi:hypothetical protein